MGKKASGEAVTGASWIRKFVTTHPDYQKDSIVSPKIARDLAVAAHEVGLGLRAAPELTGGQVIRPITRSGAWDTRLSLTGFRPRKKGGNCWRGTRGAGPSEAPRSNESIVTK